jgi:2-dehydropantoate 2-reductase
MPWLSNREIGSYVDIRREILVDSRIVIYGAGAIGGTIGAYLSRAGVPVLLVDRDAEHVRVMRERGLTIETPSGSFVQPVEAQHADELDGPLHAVWLCTKALHTREAVGAIGPRLADDGYVLSIQNGLNAPVIAEVVGAARTVSCFVNFSADRLAPGVIAYAGPSTMAVGEPDGHISDRVRRIRDALTPLQSVIVTDNIAGYLWSKLAYGALLFGTALTDATMADCVTHPRYRPVLVALAGEVVKTAKAMGIPLCPFDGWDPEAVEEPTAADRMMDALAAVMRKSTKVRSGIWRDLAVHHRRTEVDWQLVPVIEHAGRLAIPTPLLDTTVSLIHALEAGQERQGWHHLETLHGVWRRTSA